jgi:hypothetical protein
MPGPEIFIMRGKNFAVGWKGNYHIEGCAFVYADREAGRIITGSVFAMSSFTQAETVVVPEYNWDHPYWHHHQYGYWHHHRGYWVYRNGEHIFIQR